MASWFDLKDRVEALEESGLTVVSTYRGEGVLKWLAPALGDCIASAWPHRPGGGLCRWPDLPLYRSTIPAGTHGYLRGYKQHYGALLRRWASYGR
jgi:hypothetical protein